MTAGEGYERFFFFRRALSLIFVRLLFIPYVLFGRVEVEFVKLAGF